MAVADQFEIVQKIYIAFYQRPADPAGLQYWAARADAAGSAAAVIDAFANSEEAEELYGPINEETVGDAIDKIYQALFNRPAEDAGKEYFVNAFNNGEITAGNIALAILNSARNDDAVAVQYKLQVANEFTKQVDGRELTDSNFGTGSNFNVTYEGAEDAAAAREILAGVTADPASVLNADAVTQALKDQIADEGDPIGSISSGDTVSLTTGADTFNGTAGNDVINALSVDATGKAASTFSAFDKIDGGAGEDTLNIYTDVSGGPILGSRINASFPESASVKNVEIVNIYNAGNAVAAFGDASKFQGVEQLWQSGAAAAVTNLGADTTAGFRDLTTNGTALSVTAESKTTSAQVALDAVKGNDNNVVGLNVAGAALNAVTVSGDLAQQNTETGAADASLALTINVGKDVQAVTVNTTVDSTLVVNNNGKAVNTVDASASTADITFSADANVTNVKTGAGDDDITVTAAKATVDAGAGDDTITVNTLSLDSRINGGEGSDTVVLGGATFSDQSYVAINGFESIEMLEFTAATASVDASKLADYESFTFSADAANVTVSNLGAEQTAIVNAAAGAQTLNIDGKVAATVNVEASYEGKDANTVTLNVANDTKVADATLNLSGNGTVVFDNTAGETFVAVDASEQTGSLEFTAAATVAETITLGTDNGADELTVIGGSTYGAMDIIVNFDSVVDEDEEAEGADTVADELVGITGVATLVELENVTTLTGAFAAAAAAAEEAESDYVFFHFGDNTYVFGDVDGGTAGEFDANDFALQLVGIHDLSSENDAYAA